MQDARLIGRLRRKFQALAPVLDERARRHWAATEAAELPRGGVSWVAAATGLSRTTILAGMRELRDPGSDAAPPGRIRRAGGGRLCVEKADPGLEEALDVLIDPVTRGDPESPLRWTCKSTRRLAEELCRQGHRVCARTVAALLKGMGYSLQANRKTREGASHPDRDRQFEHINETVKRAIAQGEPVISVDTKKRELVGDFRAVGRELEPKGRPVEVRVHDFKDKQLGHAIPDGVYDLTADEGWVSVGISRDTATFAVNTILSWWEHLGKQRYPNATTLTITPDCGGSNSNRTRLWKVELQRLANETALQIVVCHFPPGTSKWNKIEHRLFSFISTNWRGKPLISHEVILSLIAGTTTTTGLKIYAQLDDREYPKGIQVTDQQLVAVKIQRDAFHGDWNYHISPSVMKS